MKKSFLLATLALSMSVTSVNAAPHNAQSNEADKPKVEKIASYYGVGMGAVIGTLVGGPIGLILGSAFGGMVVDNMNSENEVAALQIQNAEYQQSITMQQTELAKLSEQTASFETANMDVTEEALFPMIPELLTHIQFATGQSAISPIYHNQLDLLVNLLADHDNWLVTLTGYADRRGDEAFNYDLSRSRADMVKHYLTQGLQAKVGAQVTPNIVVKGAGESNATNTSRETNSADTNMAMNWEYLMFDRRVTIDIRPVSDVQIAQQ